MRIVIALALTLLVAVPAAAKGRKPKPVAKVPEYVVLLRGSPQSLALQNIRADTLKLTRLTEADLVVYKKDGRLIPIPRNKTIKIDEDLPAQYQWCAPTTAEFILNLASAYHAKWGKRLQINSAVRTIERQEQLKATNANAARGDTPLRRSSHLTGHTIDIAKLPMNTAQKVWMRKQLAQYERQGRIEATEESGQAVFHVMVFK